MVAAIIIGGSGEIAAIIGLYSDHNIAALQPITLSFLIYMTAATTLVSGAMFAGVLARTRNTANQESGVTAQPPEATQTPSAPDSAAADLTSERSKTGAP
jgi:ABC-type thiamin/hydroxymethylpyrimidine transport system permease subunit